MKYVWAFINSQYSDSDVPSLYSSNKKALVAFNFECENAKAKGYKLKIVHSGMEVFASWNAGNEDISLSVVKVKVN